MLKQEVADKLTAAGITFNADATKAELEALLPVDPNPSTTDTGTTELTVCDPKGNPHRTFSFAVHGDGFDALAEQYVSSRPGWTIR